MDNAPSYTVKLHGKTVGAITRLPGDRSIFSFDPAYSENPRRDTLSLSFKSDLGDLIDTFSATGPTLLPFFANLLPEGALRVLIANRAGVKAVRDLPLLALLGADLPGAVTVSVPEEMASLLESDARTAPSPTLDPEPLRFSLAGVQLKFSALRNSGKEGGLTIPVNGIGGSWIVKLPADRFDGVPENEFSIMTMARAVGIDVPPIRLVGMTDISGLPEGLGRLRGSRAFAIERFDRTVDGPVHIEDFAQITNRHPHRKYDGVSYAQIAQTLMAESGLDDAMQFVRRLVFCLLVGNDDMHLKNWSMIYHDRRRASLAPAYDLLSTAPYLPARDAALKFASTRKMADVTLVELSRLADRAGLPDRMTRMTAEDTIARFHDVWAAEKHNLYLSNAVIDVIERHLGGLALVTSR